MVITTVHKLDDALIQQIAALNMIAFRRPPMGDAIPDLTVERTATFIGTRSERRGAICTLAYEGKVLLGYSLGFSGDDVRVTDVSPEALHRLENELEMDREHIHYSVSTATFREGTGLGTLLVSGRVAQCRKPLVLMRHHRDNAGIKAIYKKLFGAPLATAPDNSLYENGVLAVYTNTLFDPSSEH